MAETMIASQMTDGQVEDLVAKFRSACLKHRDGISLEDAQTALGTENIGMIMFTLFLELTRKLTQIVVRLVRGINRECTPQQAVDTVVATGRTPYINSEVVATIPRGEGDEAKFAYVELGKYCDSNAAAMARVAELGYEPYNDVRAVIEDLRQHPDLADDNKPIVCFWTDTQGRIYWIAFSRWYDERNVCVDRDGDVWFEDWRVAARKCPKKTLDT